MPENISVAIVAGLLVAVGTLVGSVINPNFAHRIIRGLHPGIGWWRPVKRGLTSLDALILISVPLLIGSPVRSRVFLHADSR